MGKDFFKLSKKEESKLTNEERKEYLKNLREYYKENRWIENLSIKSREKLFPLLRILYYLDNFSKGNKIILMNEKDKMKKIKEQYPNRPIIYVNTHIGQPDVEIAAVALKEHFYLFSGDFENLHSGLDAFFLGLNGVTFYDMDGGKEEAKEALKNNINMLKEGKDLLWYIEQVWNILSPNNIILYSKWGVIKAASEANAIIVPLAMEEYDHKYYVNIGDPFLIEQYFDNKNSENDNKLRAITDLRDILATLKWDIWEKYGKINRDDIEEDYWDKYIERRLSEWNFTIADLKHKEYHNPNITTEEEAFKHLDSLNIDIDNAFLLRNEDNKKRILK